MMKMMKSSIEKKKKAGETDEEIGAELADVLYTITCLANSLDIDMENALKVVLKKYEKRDKDRH